MAERQRQPPHTLQAKLLALIDRADRPLSGLALRALLRAQGDRDALSNIYRALRELVGKRAVRKVHLARGYVRDTDPPAICLCCSGCGAVEHVANAETFASLESVAGSAGFGVHQFHVEVPGLCSRCTSEIAQPERG